MKHTLVHDATFLLQKPANAKAHRLSWFVEAVLAWSAVFAAVLGLVVHFTF